MQRKRSPVPKPTVRHPDRKKEADRTACRGAVGWITGVETIDGCPAFYVSEEIEGLLDTINETRTGIMGQRYDRR